VLYFQVGWPLPLRNNEGTDEQVQTIAPLYFVMFCDELFEPISLKCWQRRIVQTVLWKIRPSAPSLPIVFLKVHKIQVRQYCGISSFVIWNYSRRKFINIALLSFSYFPSNEFAIASHQLWVWKIEFSIDYIYICVSVKEKSAIPGLFEVAFVWRYYVLPRLNTKLAERGLLSS